MLKQVVKKILGQLGLRKKSGFPFVRRAYPYRPPAGPRRVLGADLLAPTTLAAGAPEPTGRIREVWKTIPGGHKWHHYFATYEEIFSQLGHRPLRMLEIGVYRGGSAKLWRQILPAGSVFVGIDIAPECKQFEDDAAGLHIRIGDQSDPTFLAQVVREFGPFDFILDDGSHYPAHMIASFRHLFLQGLKDPGIYLAEDCATNFWISHRDRGYTFVDLCKDLVDYQHAAYWDLPDEPFFRKGGTAQVPTKEDPASAPSSPRSVSATRSSRSISAGGRACPCPNICRAACFWFSGTLSSPSLPLPFPRNCSFAAHPLQAPPPFPGAVPMRSLLFLTIGALDPAHASPPLP